MNKRKKKNKAKNRNFVTIKILNCMIIKLILWGFGGLLIRNLTAAVSNANYKFDKKRLIAILLSIVLVVIGSIVLKNVLVGNFILYAVMLVGSFLVDFAIAWLVRIGEPK